MRAAAALRRLGRCDGGARLERTNRTYWRLLLDWGFGSLTLLSAGASATAAVIAFSHDDTSAMSEAILACAAAIGAAWLGRSASRAAHRRHEELVAWHGNDATLLLDAAGRIVDANDRAVEAFEAPGRPLFNLHVRALRHASAGDDADARVSEVLELGRGMYESVYTRADGGAVPVEVSARVVDMGSRRFLHLVVRDVSARLAAEEHARLADEKLRRAFSQVRLGLLLADREGRILEANHALQQILGYTLDELTSLTLRDINRPADRPRSAAWLRRLVAGETDAFVEDRWYVRKDGSEVPMSVRGSAIRDAGGAFQFIMAVVEDVTEARATSARLVAAERLAAVGSVAAGMAHDINNPLCGVQGNVAYALDVLGDPAPNAEDLRCALRDAQDAARRVRDLVRDLNAFAKGFGEGAGSTDLREVVEEAVASTRELVAPRARVSVDVPALPPVPGPAHRLSLVFDSIVRRAAEGMEVGGSDRNEIRISARADGPLRLAIDVVDTGPAIPPGDALHLFEPFYGLKAGGRGGAGLAAVLGMVRAVGGDVRAESNPRQGNVIRVLLPVARPPEIEAP